MGDIFENVHSLWIDARPIDVVRDRWTDKRGQVHAPLFSEDGPEPQKKFRWDQGEEVVVKSRRGWAVLLSQDCELEKRNPMITFGFIEGLHPNLDEKAVEIVKNRRRYRSFYLEAQKDEPVFARSFVDFGRLTTVHRDAIRLDNRYASMVDDLRDALHEDFIEFMNLNRADDEES